MHIKLKSCLKGKLDGERKLEDLKKTLTEYALESIGVIFIGSKLGVLQGHLFGLLIFR